MNTDETLPRPRDRACLTKTTDYLLCLTLLFARPTNVKYLRWGYLGGSSRWEAGIIGEAMDGSYQHPITGRNLDNAVAVGTSKLKYSSIRRPFVDRFFTARRLIVAARNTNLTVLVGTSPASETDEVTIMASLAYGGAKHVRPLFEGIRQEEGCNLLNNSLSWRLDAARDQIIHVDGALWTMRPAHLLTCPIDTANYPLCPLDGPVDPINVTIRSPESTWHHRAGRERTVTACPSCLFEFGVKAVMMS